MKKCKYHCDYGDGEYCHYEGESGCVFNRGRKLTDAESMGMLFDDAPEIPDGAILEVKNRCDGCQYHAPENFCRYQIGYPYFLSS